ncbi:hypothetical protein CRUP_024592, partial [Coryphaenoides rupestris]
SMFFEYDEDSSGTMSPFELNEALNAAALYESECSQEVKDRGIDACVSLCVLLSGSFNSLRCETPLWMAVDGSFSSAKTLRVMTLCLQYTIIHCCLLNK